MGIKINDTIPGWVDHEGMYPEEVPEILVYFSSITDMGFIEQGDHSIYLSSNQMKELAKILKRMEHY